MGEVPAPDVRKTPCLERNEHQLKTSNLNNNNLLDYSYSPEEAFNDIDEAAEEDVEEAQGLAIDVEDEEPEEEDSSNRGNTEEELTLQRNLSFTMKLSKKLKDVRESDFVGQCAEKAAQTRWEESPPTTTAQLEQSRLQRLNILWKPKHPQQGPDEIIDILQGRCFPSSVDAAGAAVSNLTAPTASVGP